MWRQQQVLSRAGANGGLGDCRSLVVGLRTYSFCGVPSWCAKPPGHIFGGSGGGSLQPQPSPSQCHASHLWRVLLLPTAGHSLSSGPFCVPLDNGPMSSLFVRCTSSCEMVYIGSALTHPNSGTTIIPAKSSPLFPPFCTYKVTLPCTLDHYSLKRALDWAETSEFQPFDYRLVWLQELSIILGIVEVYPWNWQGYPRNWQGYLWNCQRVSANLLKGICAIGRIVKGIHGIASKGNYTV